MGVPFREIEMGPVGSRLPGGAVSAVDAAPLAVVSLAGLVATPMDAAVVATVVATVCLWL